MPTKVLAFSGSSRRGSLNQRLLDAAVSGALHAGAHVSKIGLRDFELPIYDGDWEAEHGLPDGALELKTLFIKHDALLIATPEYNGGYTALLKNTIDWISRPSKGDPTGLSAITGKVAALVSASPGQLGGIRSQIALQVSLSKLGVIIIPNSFALAAAHQGFDEHGQLKDSNVEKAVRAVGAALAKTSMTIVNEGSRT
jgi:chromate reductase, NAD(P)H dehydrogenase (quinone)